MMRDDLENDDAFSAAVNGLPKVVELITAAPEGKRSLALAAAHQAYLRTAQELGYDENDAQQWASAVMSLIVTNDDEVILGRVAADLLGRPSVPPERFNRYPQIAHRSSMQFPPAPAPEQPDEGNSNGSALEVDAPKTSPK